MRQIAGLKSSSACYPNKRGMRTEVTWNSRDWRIAENPNVPVPYMEMEMRNNESIHDDDLGDDSRRFWFKVRVEIST